MAAQMFLQFYREEVNKAVYTTKNPRPLLSGNKWGRVCTFFLPEKEMCGGMHFFFP
jgi:hypothetical protein